MNELTLYDFSFSKILIILIIFYTLNTLLIIEELELVNSLKTKNITFKIPKSHIFLQLVPIFGLIYLASFLINIKKQHNQFQMESKDINIMDLKLFNGWLMFMYLTMFYISLMLIYIINFDLMIYLVILLSYYFFLIIFKSNMYVFRKNINKDFR